MQKKTSARRAGICFLAFINERTVCEADSGVRSTGSRVNVTWGTASRSRQQSAKHGYLCRRRHKVALIAESKFEI